MEYNLTQIAGACELKTACIFTKVDLKKEIYCALYLHILYMDH